MMIARAISKYNRISPRKARLVTRLLRGMTVAEAYAFLDNINKRASRYIRPVLISAFNNARGKRSDVKETDLYISKIAADSGPVLKRFRAASMGRASQIRKRTSHILIELDAKELPELKQKVKSAPVKRRAIFKRKKAKT